MFRRLVLAVAIVGLIAVGLVGGQQAAEAQETASATRSFSPSEVEPDSRLVVTIRVADYGGIGQLTETFNSDFTFVESSPAATRSGQILTFNLVADTSVNYTLTAPTTPGRRSGFAGNLEPAVGEGVTVRGPSGVTVTTPPAEPTASATRSFSPSEVEPDSRLVVTIRVADYGGIGQLTETFNSDFTFVESSPAATRSGQTLTFNLVADTSVSYTLTAPTTPGRKTGFSGNLEPAVGEGVTVRGPSGVTVTTPPAEPTASATRSFSPSEVEPDSRLVVTIRVADYGGIGQLTETFNSDFTFVESSPAATRSGQTLTFNLVADTSVSYTLTAPTTPGRKTGFSGNLEPAEGEGVRVGGPSSVTVRVVAPEPQVNRAPAFSRSSTTRPIVENSASGANVGARVTASDPDRDTLTYTLTGTDASSFTINSSTGQIMVGAGTTLDYETNASYMVTVTATDPEGASDTIDVTITVTNVDEDGMVRLSSMTPVVDVELTATLTDPDGGVTGTMWQWSKSDAMDGNYINIAGATSMNYTPVVGDANNYLRATAMYTDGHGSGKTEMATTTGMVTAVQDQEGMVALSSMTPVVGVELTATLADPDGGVTGTTWQWSRSDAMDGNFTDIGGATSMSYTPVDMDDTYYLRATAMYTDGHGPGKTAMATSANMVTAGDPLIVRYDTDPRNGQIDKSEVITAINDYLFGEVGIISKADVIRLINLYLFG